jgi:hypothetical protein
MISIEVERNSNHCFYQFYLTFCLSTPNLKLTFVNTWYLLLLLLLFRIQFATCFSLSLQFQKVQFKNAQFEKVIFKNVIKHLAKSQINL